MAAAGTVKVGVEVDLSQLKTASKLTEFLTELADLHREVKKTRQQARYLDQKCARMTERIYDLLNIEYVKRPRREGTT